MKKTCFNFNGLLSFTGVLLMKRENPFLALIQALLTACVLPGPCTGSDQQVWILGLLHQVQGS